MVDPLVRSLVARLRILERKVAKFEKHNVVMQSSNTREDVCNGGGEEKVETNPVSVWNLQAPTFVPSFAPGYWGFETDAYNCEDMGANDSVDGGKKSVDVEKLSDRPGEKDSMRKVKAEKEEATHGECDAAGKKERHKRKKKNKHMHVTFEEQEKEVERVKPMSMEDDVPQTRTVKKVRFSDVVEYDQQNTFEETAMQLGYEGITNELVPGTPVLLHGLKARSELNGEVGMATEFNQTKQRWQVEIPGLAGVLLLKAVNLQGMCADGNEEVFDMLDTNDCNSSSESDVSNTNSRALLHHG